MSKIWFTADTHFGSQRTLELSKRPFETVTEMDSAIIHNWNSVVSGKDTVYHLGDTGNPKMFHFLNYGRLFLLPGNYDTDENYFRL